MGEAALVRRLPVPSGPPPGTVDSVVGYLLARAAPFDRPTQDALRRQRGWTPRPPAAITDVRTHGRWTALPRLRELTATAAPASLVAAVQRLARLAPITSGDAVAPLLADGLLSSAMHPAGVLALADLYGVEAGFELTWHPRVSWLWPRATHEARRRCLWRLLNDVRVRPHVSLRVRPDVSVERRVEALTVRSKITLRFVHRQVDEPEG